MERVFMLAVLASLASCYQSPSLSSCKYQCGGANNDQCPGNYSCVAGMCVAPGEGCDGDGGVIDARPDADSDAGIDAPIDAPPVTCANPALFQWMNTTTLQAGSNGQAMVVVDANNDMRPDLAVVDENNAIGLFLNNGGGMFSGRLNSAAGGNARTLVAGDFDFDGVRDDLVVLNTGSTNAMNVLKSVGNGTYNRTQFSLTAGDVPTDIAAGDFNNDGHDDVVVLYTANMPRVQMLLQTSSSFQLGTSGAANTTTTSIEVGDGNTVAGLDILATLGNGNFGIHVVTGVSPADVVVSGVMGAPSDVAVGPLRGPGMPPSLVLALGNGGTVSLRHAVSANSYAAGPDVAVGMQTNSQPKAVILAQIAGDSKLDIVTANQGGNTFTVLVNNGADSFTPHHRAINGNNPVDIVSADFDGDSRNDVAILNSATNEIQLFFNKCP